MTFHSRCRCTRLRQPAHLRARLVSACIRLTLTMVSRLTAWLNVGQEADTLPRRRLDTGEWASLLDAVAATLTRAWMGGCGQCRACCLRSRSPGSRVRRRRAGRAGRRRSHPGARHPCDPRGTPRDTGGLAARHARRQLTPGLIVPPELPGGHGAAPSAGQRSFYVRMSCPHCSRTGNSRECPQWITALRAMCHGLDPRADRDRRLPVVPRSLSRVRGRRLPCAGPTRTGSSQPPRMVCG